MQEIRNFEKVFLPDFQKMEPAVIYIVEGEMNGTSQGPGWKIRSALEGGK